MSDPSSNETKINSVKLIPTSVVLDRTCLSRTSLHRLVKLGEFPKSVPVGRQRVGYVEAEVNAWIDNRIALRNDETTALLKRRRALRALEGRS